MTARYFTRPKQKMTASNTAFSVLSFIGVILVCIPLPWHLKAWNVGTCLFSVWVAISLLMYCVNSIIWNSDTINRAPVWCDISSRIAYASTLGISTASLCINRGLYNITSLQTIAWSTAKKRRAMIIDLTMGVGVPVLLVGLEYTVQIYRFAILEEIGCYPTYVTTPMTLLFVNVPPVVLSFTSAAYAIRTIIIRRRKEEEIRRNLFTTPNFHASLWYRLLALAGLDILVFIPHCTFVILSNIPLGLRHWISWNDTRSRISLVKEVPSIEWQTPLIRRVLFELPRWIRIIFAYYFFALFGLTRDARSRYKMAWNSLMKGIGCGTRPSRKTLPLRFESIRGRFHFGRSRTGGTFNISISSGREDDDRAILDSVPDSIPDSIPDQGGTCKEAVP